MAFFHFFLPHVGRRNDSLLKTKEPFCLFKRMDLYLCVFSRLNIPPFVPARTVLDGLESEDLCGNEKPLKNEITATKVKEPRDAHFSDQTFNPDRFAFSNSAFLSSVHKTSDRAKQKRVKEETGDLLRLCHTVPLEVVSLGELSCVYCLFRSETQPKDHVSFYLE